MSGANLRHKYFREFRSFSGQGRWSCAVIVLGYVGQIGAALWAGQYLLANDPGLGQAVLLAMLILFIGTRLRGLNNIVHECTHFSFTTRREDNVFFGRLCASLILSSFHDYRAEHMTHHAHVGDYEKDEDLKAIQRFRLEDPLTPRTILRHAVTPFLGLHLPYYCKPNLSGRDGAAFLALKLALVAAAVLALALAPLEAALLLWVPFVWAFSAINYWTDCIDHGGLLGEADELQASRNVAVPDFLRPLLFPRNDCYHLVHHLFPQVPARHLDACHERLLEDPAYRARVGGEPHRPVVAEAEGALGAAH